MRDSGLFSGISNDDYHASAGVSSSQLKLALKSPRLYQANMLGEVKHKSTPAMALGTTVHKLVLEPDDFDSDIVVGQSWGRSSAAKQAKEAFLAEHAGKLVITEEQMTTARAMSDSLMRLPDAKALLKDGEPELSGYYNDDASGQLCRYRPDYRLDYALVDIKTALDASPDGFSRAIANYGYALSAAHYIHGDKILTGSTHRQFVFLVVESSPPHLAATYVLADEDLCFGEWQRAKALEIIRQCKESGEWPDYNGNVAQQIGLPLWAKREYLESCK